jgi:hypothetical protein
VKKILNEFKEKKEKEREENQIILIIWLDKTINEYDYECWDIDKKNCKKKTKLDKIEKNNLRDRRSRFKKN